MSEERPWEDYPDPLAPPKKQGNLSALVTGGPLPDPEPVGYGEDVVKGLGGGLGRGVAGLVGAPGDLAEYGARGIDWATRKMGGILGVDVKPREAQAPTYGSAAAKENIESVTGKFYEPKTIPGQFASTIAEFAPAAAIPGGGGVAARVFNTVVPAVASETAGQLTKGTAAEPYVRAIAGITSGPAAAKLVTPAAPASAARQAAVATLEREGVPLTAGQRTGSKPIQWMEATAADMPFSSGRAAAMNAEQAAAFDRAVTRRVFDPAQLEARGVPPGTSLPDPRVVQAGRQSLSDEYTRLSRNNQLRSDPQLHSDLIAAETSYARNTLPSQRSGDVERIRNDIVDQLVANQGRMPGDVYQANRSRLGTLAQSQGNDPYLANALRDMRGALDRAMQRGLSPAEAEAWVRNNQRWANMRQTEGAVAKAGENISPLALAQGARSGRVGQYAARSGDLDELSHAGSLVLKPVPQSGTAPRLGWQQMFNIPSLIAGGVGGGIGTAIGGPLLGGAAAAATPFVASRLALSRPGQAYLGNQLLPQNMRDIVTQALTQQAITQPSIVRRNQAERDYYEKHRPNPLEPQ